MSDSNEHLYDYAPLAEALTDIATALGHTDLDFYTQPDKAQALARETVERLQALGNATPALTNTTATHVGAEENPLDDPAVVAVFRLPIDISHLVSISNLVETLYGPGLVTQSYATPTLSRCFVIKRPDAAPNTPNAHTDSAAHTDKDTDDA